MNISYSLFWFLPYNVQCVHKIDNDRWTELCNESTVPIWELNIFSHCVDDPTLIGSISTYKWCLYLNFNANGSRTEYVLNLTLLDSNIRYDIMYVTLCFLYSIYVRANEICMKFVEYMYIFNIFFFHVHFKHSSNSILLIYCVFSAIFVENLLR